jgi:hypothetical protein
VGPCGAEGGAGGGNWTIISKAADTVRTNNTLSADPELAVTLLANTQYRIRFKVFLSAGNATGDVRMQLTFAGTTTRVRRRPIRTATGADVPVAAVIGTAFDAAAVNLSTTGTNAYYEDDIILQVGASGGILAFQWAQVTTNATGATCHEGSYMEYQTT